MKQVLLLLALAALCIPVTACTNQETASEPAPTEPATVTPVPTEPAASPVPTEPATAPLPTEPAASPVPTEPVAEFVPIIYFFGWGDRACLMGSAQEGVWQDASTTAPLLSGGETYRMCSLEQAVSTVTGSVPVTNEPPCDWVHWVTMTPSNSDTPLLGIGGTHEPLPREPQLTSTGQDVYQEAVRSVLQQQGITNPDVNIIQIIRFDAEGDGVEEVLVNATRYEQPGFPVVNSGEYSLILLRKLVNGQVETQLISSDIHVEAAEFVAPLTFTIQNILDINQDGTLEVVIMSEYYEGDSVSIYTINGTVLEPVLECGCGF